MPGSSSYGCSDLVKLYSAPFLGLARRERHVESWLKSLRADEKKGVVHPIRSRYAASFSYGACGDAHEGVAMGEMDARTVEAIGEKRAARATLVPVGSEHEVVREQLAVLTEQIGSVFSPSAPSNT